MEILQEPFKNTTLLLMVV